MQPSVTYTNYRLKSHLDHRSQQGEPRVHRHTASARVSQSRATRSTEPLPPGCAAHVFSASSRAGLTTRKPLIDDVDGDPLSRRCVWCVELPSQPTILHWSPDLEVKDPKSKLRVDQSMSKSPSDEDANPTPPRSLVNLSVSGSGTPISGTPISFTREQERRGKKRSTSLFSRIRSRPERVGMSTPGPAPSDPPGETTQPVGDTAQQSLTTEGQGTNLLPGSGTTTIPQAVLEVSAQDQLPAWFLPYHQYVMTEVGKLSGKLTEVAPRSPPSATLRTTRRS